MKYYTEPTSDGKVTVMRTSFFGSRHLIVDDVNMNFGTPEVHPIELTAEDGAKLVDHLNVMKPKLYPITRRINWECLERMAGQVGAKYWYHNRCCNHC